ncbi:MAG TPA: hypothetical protein VH479_08095 [Acidimicrobiales bacterium]
MARVSVALALAGALLCTAPGGAGPRPAAAAPAAPRPTGVIHVSWRTEPSYTFVKDVVAECPAGKVVLGGGAFVVSATGSPPVRTPFALTRLVPYWSGGSRHYAYAATAVNTSPVPYLWWLSVEAICADPMTGYQIVSGASERSASPVKSAAPACPDTTRQRVLGTGAMVATTTGSPAAGPVLQVARADARGVLTRAQAHTRPAGFSDEWQLYGYAVCALTPDGYQVRGGSSAAGPARFKTATASCTGDRQVVSRGGAVSNVAPGNVALTTLTFTSHDDMGAGSRVEASWNSPLELADRDAPIDWDSIVAQSICVAR